MRFFIYFGEGVKIAYEALKSYKLRSILTTLGIVIGVTTVITIVALIQGLNQAFSNQISALGSDVLYIDKFPWMMGGDTWWRYRNRPNLTIEDAERVKELSNMARAVAPTLYTRRTVKFQELSLDRTPVIGSTPDWVVTSNTYPEYGRFITHNDVHRRRHVAMIGTGIVDQLFPNSDPLGESILIDGIKFTVVGIQEKKGKFFDNDLDAQVIIPITAFQTAFGVRFRSVHIEVKAPSPQVLDDAEIELTGVMRRIKGLKGDEENNFAINKQSMLMDTYKNLTGTLWAVAIGVGAISLLVGGIGIMNILLVSVTERTREIGIRKALGARRRDILWQFLIESMMICALGVFLGILLAVGLAKLVAAISPIPAAITLWVAFLGIGFVVAIGLVFGIYPAHKASKLNPIEALRFE